MLLKLTYPQSFKFSFFFFYKAILVVCYFITRLYVIFNFISSFYFILRLPFITKNLFFFNSFNILEKKIFYIVRFKSRNAFLPTVQKLQVRAAFNFIKKSYNKQGFFNFKVTNPHVNFWNSSFINELKFSTDKKMKKNKVVFFRKNHNLLLKLFFTKLKANFFIKRIRKNKILRVFSTLKKKGYKQLGFFFTFNIIKLLIRVFPFFNKFFLYKIIKLGLVFINNKMVTNAKISANVGDLIRLNMIKNFNILYYRWVNKQYKYIRLLYKNLFQYFRSQRLTEKPKNYLSSTTLYNNLYKKIPKWLEVNYLSMSFFIIKNPTYFSYRSYYINPFLFRLLTW